MKPIKATMQVEGKKRCCGAEADTERNGGADPSQNPPASDLEDCCEGKSLKQTVNNTAEAFRLCLL